MRESAARLALITTIASVATAQQFTFNFVTGTNITNHFPVNEFRYPGDAFNPPSFFRYSSGGRSPILGGSIEAAFSKRFSFEAGILHRSMNSRIFFEEFRPGGNTSTVTEFTAARTWMFPLLLKYHLPSIYGVRPFVGGGMSFRTQEDVAGTEPSQSGFSAGAGATIAWKSLRISPTIRYTRWAREDVYPRYPTKADQVEFLTAFGFATESARNSSALGRFHFGVIAGIPLTAGFASPRFPGMLPEEERFRFAAGLSIEGRIHPNWAIEVDGIYRPIRIKGDNPDRPTEYSVLTWQIPVLAKYSWGDVGNWRPFVSGGPSFRPSGNLNGRPPSKFGGTVGGGFERRLRENIVIAPTFRYTRWQEDRRFNPNTAELLLGISF